jgi:hypothetical protein
VSDVQFDMNLSRQASFDICVIIVCHGVTLNFLPERAGPSDSA